MSGLNDRQHVAAVFMDMTKAFDYVNHDRLLVKLCSYGIRGVAFDLFKSYLENRKQYCEINTIGPKTKR